MNEKEPRRIRLHIHVKIAMIKRRIEKQIDVTEQNYLQKDRHFNFKRV